MANCIGWLALTLASMTLCGSLGVAAEPAQKASVSANKRTVQKYMEAFGRTDHEAILSCLTDDVQWVIPGMFKASGKAAFDKEIENEAFTGHPTIKVTRLTEENDVVIAEGTVRCSRKEGGELNMAFCDVFEMQGGKITRLTSYLMELKQ